MKFSILLCLCILIASNAWAETRLDIDGAVAMAIENNLSLRRAEIDTASAQRRHSRSWNSLIPSIGAGALVSHPAAGVVEPVPPPPQSVWTPGISLSATLNITPAILANINQTKQEYEAGRINYEAARQDLEFQVRRLYYQILLLRANTELAERNIVSAQSRYDQTRALMSVGRASTLEELAARLDVSTQQTNAQGNRAAYQTALDHLKYFLMIPVEETVELEGDLLNFLTQDPNTVNRSGRESIQVGLLRQSIAVIEAQRRYAHLRSYAPNLTFSWNSTPIYVDALSQWRDSNGLFSITLSLRADNFLPWSQAKEQIDTLSDAIDKQRSLLTEASINHQNTVQKLLRDIARSEETIETLHLNITLAEETLRMQTTAHSQGAVELQTLNNTRDNLFAAQNRLLSEQFNLLSLILELERELNIPFGSIAQEG